jgi:CHASE3 domain sensor protein
MKTCKIQAQKIVAGLLLATGLAVAPMSAFATEQAKQRQAARDVRQDTRQGAREAKQDCRAADQKNNAGCRQDKRGSKQDGREKARDIKY